MFSIAISRAQQRVDDDIKDSDMVPKATSTVSHPKLHDTAIALVTTPQQYLNGHISNLLCNKRNLITQPILHVSSTPSSKQHAQTEVTPGYALQRLSCAEATRSGPLLQALKAAIVRVGRECFVNDCIARAVLRMIVHAPNKVVHTVTLLLELSRLQPLERGLGVCYSNKRVHDDVATHVSVTFTTACLRNIEAMRSSVDISVGPSVSSVRRPEDARTTEDDSGRPPSCNVVSGLVSNQRASNATMPPQQLRTGTASFSFMTSFLLSPPSFPENHGKKGSPIPYPFESLVGSRVPVAKSRSAASWPENTTSLRNSTLSNLRPEVWYTSNLLSGSG
ncbi:hypothetical protein KCU71_g182, partial [Aureobasidium melanogenum]